MLQIRLRKLSSDSGGGAVVKPLPVEVTVACPDHLVLADLPVAKGIGAAAAASTVKTFGRRSRRHLGERVHFCVRCDFPIAIYGRLSPCEHAFCLDCARSDSLCYLCDERIQKIQTIKMMEGIFICAAPHCLKSFLKRSDFESHIQGSHAHLLQPNAEKEERHDESEVQRAKQSTASDSSVRPPLRPLFSPDSNPQLHQSRELPLQRPMMLPKPPYYGPAPNYSLESLPGLQNHFQQGMMGTLQQDIGQFADKQQGILSETSMPENLPMNAIRPPNFIVPMNTNPSLTPQYGIPPPFQPEAGQQFYNAQYDMGQTPRTDSAQEAGVEQGSLLGLAPGPAGGGMNFMGNYPQPWHAGPSPGGQGTGDGFVNGSDSQGSSTFYQGDYGRNSGVLPMMATPPSTVDKGMEGMQGTNNAMDPRDGPGIVAPQPFPHAPPPPPLLPHSSHGKRGKYYSGDMGRDGHGFGWQQEKQDGFGSGQD